MTIARYVLALVWFCGVSLAAQTVDRVTRVVDGDTVVLATLGTARLIGVDTPETVDPRKPVQAFGKEASAFTKRLALGKAVRVERDQTATDKYGRVLVYLFLVDGGTLVNLEIVRHGYGHAYTLFPFSKMEQFRAAERAARTARIGLWAAGAPVTENATTVYVMPSGGKYHTATCQHVSTTKQAMRLDETPGHYTPCKVCKPPLLK